MSFWMENLNELQHYYELRREAEQNRLARQAREGRPGNHKAFCIAMRWLGSRLSAWGNQLQERFSPDTAATNFVVSQSD